MTPISVRTGGRSIEELSDWFKDAQPQDVLRWALLEAGFDRVAVASSFQAEGTAVIHMATRIRPDVPVLFIDTGFHFAETLAFKQRLTELLNLNVIDLAPEHTVDEFEQQMGPRLYERDSSLCCEMNKVGVWRRALRSLDMWITAMRRDSAWTRGESSVLSVQDDGTGRKIVKVNPVANWTRPDVWRYLGRYDIPHNPLYDLGFTSIGCAPCTRAVLPGEDERAGRWSGTSKVECGIHVAEIERQRDA